MAIPNAVASTLIDDVTQRGKKTVYFCLLQTDIDPAVDTLATMSEDTTAGGGRKTVAWTDPSTANPPLSSPTADVTFGPYSADMTTGVTVLALVDAASGSTGTIRKTFNLNATYSPKAGDFITVPATDLSLGVQ